MSVDRCDSESGELRGGCPCSGNPDHCFSRGMDYARRLGRYYDISPPISSDLATWPGDVPFHSDVQRQDTAGVQITTSTLHLTAHLGAHADAPSHYDAEGLDIDECDLDAYLGPCQVIHVEVPRGALVTPAMILEPVLVPRVLIGTATHPTTERFNEDFAGLSVELIDGLRAAGVTLIGVDTPSVDRFQDADLPAHRRIAAQDMRILEGLVLSAVPAGVYELIALPLKLVGCDGSPVRAILRTIELE